MAAEQKPQQQGKRKPGWMSIPGGPKEPVFADFQAKLKELTTAKSKLFDRMAEIREELGGGKSEEDQAVREERMLLNARLKQIEEERKAQRATQEEKLAERRGVKDERIALRRQLEDVTADLGVFKTLDDIEDAIDRVLIHMETGSGTLKSEKKTLKRITQLEKAKGLLLQLRPMQERIADAEAQERHLKDEYEELYSKIQNLNSEFKSVAEKKSKAVADKKAQQVDRTKLNDERTKIREKITALNEQITKLRAEFDEKKVAWNEWREKAQQLYKEKREAEQKEYEAKRAAREKERKDARKAQKALKKLNPYANEIDACTGLIRYLEEKINAQKRDKEKAEHDKKLAAFNAAASAPAGFSVGRANEEDDWAFGDRTQKKQKQKAPKKVEKKTEETDGKPREKMITLSFDRVRSFELVSVERPMTFAQIPNTVEILKKKKVEYESHIKSIDEVSTDASSEEDEEEQPAAEAEAAATE